MLLKCTVKTAHARSNTRSRMRLTYAHAHTHSPFAASSACLAASLRGDPVFMLQVHIGVCVEESQSESESEIGSESESDSRPVTNAHKKAHTRSRCELTHQNRSSAAWMHCSFAQPQLYHLGSIVFEQGYTALLVYRLQRLFLCR